MTDETIEGEELSILDRALAACPRDEDGNADEEILVKLIATLIDVDVDKVKRERAKQLVSASTKPGSTPPDGALQLFDTYPYEPRRLVRDDQGNIVEQDAAKLRMKQAESQRARRHVDQVQVWANRKTREAEEFATWVVEQTEQGRAKSELTFGVFVRESGKWSPAVSGDTP